MLSFSIVICTYNPDPVILQRLLAAVKCFGENKLSKHEIIIVDNNSNPSLSINPEVINFLNVIHSASLITEKSPGLTSARIAGVNASKHNWIIFFDDDNEPVFDYLDNAEKDIKEHPEVGCWGPGKIQVEFIGSVNSWILSKKDVFQERTTLEMRFDNKHHWQDCYPYGTGMIVRKEILLEYISRINANHYTLSDRKGKSLMSGGDIQIVLTGIRMGYYAGISPSISLNHLIKAGKATKSYILKLCYGTASSYILAFNEVFPNEAIKPEKISNYKILKTLYTWFRIHFLKGNNKKNSLLLISQRIGEMNAQVLAKGSAKPFLLRLFEKIIQVK